MHVGSCLCGAITFEVKENLPHGDACHCVDCRKWTGHFLASSDVKKDSLSIKGEENLTWYASSEKVERGFCARCGSSLFWKPLHKDWIGIALGAIDQKTETKIGLHIYTTQKADYYQISDDAKQYKTTPLAP